MALGWLRPWYQYKYGGKQGLHGLTRRQTVGHKAHKGTLGAQPHPQMPAPLSLLATGLLHRLGPRDHRQLGLGTLAAAACPAQSCRSLVSVQPPHWLQKPQHSLWGWELSWPPWGHLQDAGGSLAPFCFLCFLPIPLLRTERLRVKALHDQRGGARSVSPARSSSGGSTLVVRITWPHGQEQTLDPGEGCFSAALGPSLCFRRVDSRAL